MYNRFVNTFQAQCVHMLPFLPVCMQAPGWNRVKSAFPSNFPLVKHWRVFTYILENKSFINPTGIHVSEVGLFSSILILKSYFYIPYWCWDVLEIEYKLTTKYLLSMVELLDSMVFSSTHLSTTGILGCCCNSSVKYNSKLILEISRWGEGLRETSKRKWILKILTIL